MLLFVLIVLLCGTATADIIAQVETSPGVWETIASTETDYHSATVDWGALAGESGQVRYLCIPPVDGYSYSSSQFYRQNTPKQQNSYWVNIQALDTSDPNCRVMATTLKPGVFDGNPTDESEVGYQITVKWFTGQRDANGKAIFESESLRFYVNATGNGTTVLCGETWYPANHAHAFGPKLEGSWQTYAVVDLYKQGTQTFPLIAAGAWNIGTVNVSIKGDNMTVTYKMHEDLEKRDYWNDITVSAEKLQFVTDVPTADKLAEAENFAFGKTIPVYNTFGMARGAAMYLELEVSYPSHSPFVYRFWPNLPANKALVQQMEALLAE